MLRPAPSREKSADTPKVSTRSVCGLSAGPTEESRRGRTLTAALSLLVSTFDFQSLSAILCDWRTGIFYFSRKLWERNGGGEREVYLATGKTNDRALFSFIFFSLLSVWQWRQCFFFFLPDTMPLLNKCLNSPPNIPIQIPDHFFFLRFVGSLLLFIRSPSLRTRLCHYTTSRAFPGRV